MCGSRKYPSPHGGFVQFDPQPPSPWIFHSRGIHGTPPILGISIIFYWVPYPLGIPYP